MMSSSAHPITDKAHPEHFVSVTVADMPNVSLKAAISSRSTVARSHLCKEVPKDSFQKDKSRTNLRRMNDCVSEKRGITQEISQLGKISTFIL